jgi:hypothetical protein
VTAELRPAAAGRVGLELPAGLRVARLRGAAAVPEAATTGLVVDVAAGRQVSVEALPRPR